MMSDFNHAMPHIIIGYELIQSSDILLLFCELSQTKLSSYVKLFGTYNIELQQNMSVSSRIIFQLQQINTLKCLPNTKLKSNFGASLIITIVAKILVACLARFALSCDDNNIPLYHCILHIEVQITYGYTRSGCKYIY